MAALYLEVEWVRGVGSVFIDMEGGSLLRCCAVCWVISLNPLLLIVHARVLPYCFFSQTCDSCDICFAFILFWTLALQYVGCFLQQNGLLSGFASCSV